MQRKTATAGVVALLVLIGIAWMVARFTDDGYSDDPDVAALERLRDATMSQPAAERDAARPEFRERMQGLTPQQRMAFMESSAPKFMPMMEKRIDDFLALPPEQQQQEMDRRIDQQEQRRREREAQVADQGADQGASRFGSLSPAQRDAMRKKRLDMTTPELRAKFEVVREMYRKRREQRGLNPGEGGFLR